MATLCAVYASFRDTPLKMAIVVVLAIAFGMGVVKPRPMYSPDGAMLNFGTRPGETLMPAWLAIMLVGYTVYFIGMCGSVTCSSGKV